MVQQKRTIFFAGGGTGGHLFPSLAVAERLREHSHTLQSHFLCSERPIDREVLEGEGVEGGRYTQLPVRPLPRSVGQGVRFIPRYWAGARRAKQVMRDKQAGCVAAMGGFVSGPVARAARGLAVPVVLVNLDASPGVANRYLARRCEEVYTVYPSPLFPEARTRPIPMPLRRASIGPADRADARVSLGLDPHQPLLLVTGASQGASSINQMMIELANRAEFRDALRGWRVLHLTGAGREEPVEWAYRSQGLDATVWPFTRRMGAAWAAAELAVSRAGANSVAEAAANRTPTIFIPYPYHKDQHQKLNARPVVQAGGGMLIEDAVEPGVNAQRVGSEVMRLMDESQARREMREKLSGLDREDGAAALADRLVKLCEGRKV